MADYCTIAYLNSMVTPSPTGWGLDVTIKAWVTTDKKVTHSDIWDKIQASGLDAVIKALSKDEIRTIMDWMVSQGQIGKPELQTITYSPEP